MLTSPPLAQPIDVTQIQTGDLIRQKNGHHVLFIVSRINDTINYIDSSRLGGGVKTNSFSLLKPNIKIDGVFRLTSLQSIPDISAD